MTAIVTFIITTLNDGTNNLTLMTKTFPSLTSRHFQATTLAALVLLHGSSPGIFSSPLLDDKNKIGFRVSYLLFDNSQAVKLVSLPSFFLACNAKKKNRETSKSISLL